MYSYTIQLSGVMNELHIICGVACLALSVVDVPTLPAPDPGNNKVLWVSCVAVCATYKCTKLPT